MSRRAAWALLAAVLAVVGILVGTAEHFSGLSGAAVTTAPDGYVRSSVVSTEEAANALLSAPVHHEAERVTEPTGHYDSPSQLARASARSSGYRLAPDTAGLADDVLALLPGGANLSQPRLDHIVARHWPVARRRTRGTLPGSFRPNTNHRPGDDLRAQRRVVDRYERKRAATGRLRVVVDPNGNVITAFPY